MPVGLTDAVITVAWPSSTFVIRPASCRSSFTTRIWPPLRSEFVIQITGEVRLRPDGNENTHLATGKIEVVAETIEILAKSDALPFQVSTALENESENKLPGEDVRLKYRYLDLRRPSMQYNLKLRSDMG